MFVVVSSAALKQLPIRNKLVLVTRKRKYSPPIHLSHFRVHSSRQIVTAVIGRRRRKENVPGNIYVDSSCIDCDTCRWMAPYTFARQNGQSYVFQQPQTEEELQNALRALVSCPTGSIREEKPSKIVKEAQTSFPFPVHVDLSTVYYMGFASPKSFGACSYLWTDFQTQSPTTVMVDSPRYFTPLAKNILELYGPVEWIFLTHRDDVADHERWSSFFNAKRIIHEQDAIGNLQNVEWILQGEGPWYLSDQLKLIHVPGHTRGSTVILDQKHGVLFTGDHLAFDADIGQLSAFPKVCWYDWQQQKASVAKLMEESFEWILPGHGRILSDFGLCRCYRFRTQQERKDMLLKVIKEE
eukprot:jgi/Galph1/5489/GphlegSOOS_G4180.1